MLPRICFSLSLLRPKASIDPCIYPYVDSTLKRLKLVTRRLVAALTAFEEESRVLDRLFYKGKSQHSISLFWRRVKEIQRFCNRMQELDLSACVTRIRCAFYNSTDYQNQTILKSPWTHLPDVKALRVAAHSFGSLREFLLKMLDRFVGAYCTLKRVMQTGGFLQTILTLSAIVCRLRALTQIILEIQEELTTALLDLCESLETHPTLKPSKRQSMQLLKETASNNSPSPPLDTTVSLQHGTHLREPSTFPVTIDTSTDGLKTKVDQAINKSSELPESQAKNTVAKARKKKTPRNEIDIIFGLQSS